LQAFYVDWLASVPIQCRRLADRRLPDLTLAELAERRDWR
jgi:hypothetical protein